MAKQWYDRVGGSLSNGPKATMAVTNDLAHGEGGDAKADWSKQLKYDDNNLFGGKVFGNPLQQKPVNTAPDPVAPGAVSIPMMNPTTTPVTVHGAPSRMAGTLIGNPGTLPITPINVNPLMGNYQNTLAQQLANRASGNDPNSVAQLASNQQRQANQAQTMAQLASVRGPANPLAARTAMMTNVAQNAQLNRDTMMAKIQEQQNAQALLGQVAGQARGQDIQLGTAQAQLQQEAQLTAYKGQLDKAIAQGQMDQRTAEMMFQQAQENARMNAQLGQAFQESQMKYMQMGLDAQKANQMAALETERLRQSGALGNAQIAAGQNAANKQLAGGILGAGAGVFGSIYGGRKGQEVGEEVGNDISGDVNGSSTTDSYSRPDESEHPWG